jgi:hemoglobin
VAKRRRRWGAPKHPNLTPVEHKRVTGGQDPNDPSGEPVTVYELVGGMEYFIALVDRFYDAVQSDAILRPLYPEDLADARRHTALFLAQYWGGPPIYNNERGHPRLRMRHAPFVIAEAERDRWLGHMLDSVAATELHPEVEKLFVNYFEHASTAMINSE